MKVYLSKLSSLSASIHPHTLRLVWVSILVLGGLVLNSPPIGGDVGN